MSFVVFLFYSPGMLNPDDVRLVLFLLKCVCVSVLYVAKGCVVLELRPPSFAFPFPLLCE